MSSNRNGLKLVSKDFEQESDSILKEVEEDELSYHFEDPDKVLNNILSRAKEYESRKTNERVKQIIKESYDELEDDVEDNYDSSLSKSEDVINRLIAEEMSKVDKEWTQSEIKLLENEILQLNLVKLDDFRKDNKPTYRRIRKKKKIFFLVAAIVILSLGATLTSQGSRNFVFEKLIKAKDTDAIILLSSDEKDGLLYKDNLDLAYQGIKDELGIRPIKLDYRPEGMVYENHSVNKISGESFIIFSQNENNLMLYQFVARNSRVSAITMDGNMIQECETIWLNKTIEIYEIKDENNNILYAVSIEIDNAHYEIHARMNLEEFVKIISNLKYF